MTVSESIKKRRAIYPSQYKEGNISEKDIKEILENANFAPTHRLTQPWFFKVYQNESKLELAKSMVNHYKLLGNPKNVSIKEKKITEKCFQSNCIIAIITYKNGGITIYFNYCVIKRIYAVIYRNNVFN